MGNKATNIDQQINLLRKRGMILDCGLDKAKEHLLDIGYYRLGFYWFPFEMKNKHEFKPGTQFSTVISLYYLDVDLKFLLMRALNRIEINLRTKIVYTVSNKYPNSPTWFSDPKVMNGKFVNNFNKIYNERFIKNNKPLKAHHEKYINHRYAPAWKTIEFLTFGSIFKIYRCLKNEDLKRRIANLYGIKKVSVFINYFRTIIFIRNICAHSGLLFDSNTPLAIKPTPLIEMNNNNRHSLDSAIKVILYFLNQVSENRKNDLANKIEEIFRDYSKNQEIKQIIEQKIGYKFC